MSKVGWRHKANETVATQIATFLFISTPFSYNSDAFGEVEAKCLALQAGSVNRIVFLKSTFLEAALLNVCCFWLLTCFTSTPIAFKHT